VLYVVRLLVAGCWLPVPRRLVFAGTILQNNNTIFKVNFSYAYTVHTVEFRYNVFINTVNTGSSLSSFKQSKMIVLLCAVSLKLT